MRVSICEHSVYVNMCVCVAMCACVSGHVSAGVCLHMCMGKGVYLSVLCEHMSMYMCVCARSYIYACTVHMCI